MERQEVQSLFARAARKEMYKGEYHTEEEWLDVLSKDGARRFKSKCFEDGGEEVIASLDEFAKILLELRMADSLEEAKQIFPRLGGNHWIELPRKFFCEDKMLISAVESISGDKKYRVKTYSSD